ncbi:MAG: glycosyltransferase family 2 protein [Geminicoccaceae bacterium]
MVAVMVLNWNRRELLRACLKSVFASTWADLEVLVTDCGSTDGSADLVAAEFPTARLLRLPRNLGAAGGRNASIVWARRHLPCDWCFLIDNDTTLAQDCIDQLVAVGGQDDRIGIVTAKAFCSKGDDRLLAAGGMAFNAYTGAAWDVARGEPDRGQHDRQVDVQACPGYAMFVRTSILDGVGMFDEGFNPYGWEDVDFSLRVRRHGFRITYAPSAVVYHAGGRIGRGPVSSYEAHKARNLIRLVRLHSTPLQWSCFLGLLPLRAGWRVVRELATGNPRTVTAWLRGVLARDRSSHDTS